ncbi:MAG: Na+/H+ antiporter NhaC family protein [Bacteroidales bacterium]|nr:Na+/H+ antiporter NhaC family protein [Bacteroidales bacterium]
MKPRWLSISPLLVFILFYLITSIILQDFYKIPIIVAFLVSGIYALVVFRKQPFEERLKCFSQGAGNPSIMLMVWIFVLAGAFALSAKEMGAIDATVGLALHLLPDNMLLPGFFLAACFISLSIGTSVGTVVALTPVAAGVAEQTGCLLPLMVASVVGGAFFGDNLSFISDTTIVATQSQGCQMRDKFFANIRMVLPAALVVLVIYVIIGLDIHAPQTLPDVEWIKVLPYLAVLSLAIIGMNVMFVLIIGIILSGIIGIATSSYDLWGWFAAINTGVMGMGELIVVTLLAGGMLELIRENGGIDYLTSLLTRRIRSQRGAELSIAALVTISDVCTANNTVAIITVGSIAKDVSSRFGVDPRRTASILDTFGCFAQGLIPYGAQLLMASGLAMLSPTQIIPYLFYPFAIGFFALVCILLRYPRKYCIKK